MAVQGLNCGNGLNRRCNHVRAPRIQSVALTAAGHKNLCRIYNPAGRGAVHPVKSGEMWRQRVVLQGASRKLGVK